LFTCWTLESILCWFWFFDMIWTTFCHVTFLCDFLVYLVFRPNCISGWFLKVLCMHIYYVYILACFAFFDPIHRVNSIKILNWLRCAWNSISYLCTYFVEFFLCMVVSLTTLYPMGLGTILYLNCFRYMWDTLEACLIHNEEVTAKWLLVTS